MASIFDVNPNKLIEQVAVHLKENDNIIAPDWASFVKTGNHKERPPQNPDWWYVRSAAVLRKVAILGPIGVSKLRVHYGGKKDRGMQPEIFRKGSGNIARKVLQQLEKAGYIKQEQKGIHKGRVLTPQGKSLLDKTAQKLFSENGKVQTSQ